MKYILSLFLGLTLITSFGQLTITSDNGNNNYTCDNEKIVLKVENSNLYSNFVWTKISYIGAVPTIETLTNTTDSLVIDNEPAYLYIYQVTADYSSIAVTGTKTLLIRPSTTSELVISGGTAGDYESTCYGNTIKVNFAGSVSSNHAFEWSKKNNLNQWEVIPLHTDYWLDIDNDGVYKLKVNVNVNDLTTCHIYDEIEIKILNPAVNIGDPNKNMCEGKSVILKPISVPSNAEPLVYNWNTGFSSASQITVNTEGFYTLETSYATTQGLPCNSSATFEVVKAPNPDLQDIPELTTAILPFEINGGDYITPANDYDFIWHKEDGDIISVNVLSSHTEAGNYTLTATNKTTGCFTTKPGSLIHLIKDAVEAFVPNVLAPNEADENNQSLRVYGEDITNKNFTFEVFNRWGEIVYSTTNFNDAKNIGWQGNKNNSGDLLESGSYTYKVKGEYTNGEAFNKIGYATLIR